MFSSLKKHPFAVEAFFEWSLVLTFAVPKDELKSLLPPCMELDTFKDQWAFVAMALVQTKDLRPKGFPRLFGNDFFLIGYRVFVRYTNAEGKRLRGLYILKSQTDKKKMEVLGNIFTQYKYSTTDIKQETFEGAMKISSLKSNFNIEMETGNTDAQLPVHSPFSEWKEARRFAGPLPFTFTYSEMNKEVLIIEGVREHWEPSPVNVLQYDISFLKSLQLKDMHLANAFIIHNIPYHWKKGRIEKWHG